MRTLMMQTSEVRVDHNGQRPPACRPAGLAFTLIDHAAGQEALTEISGLPSKLPM
jgi:hypothetical protein